MPRLEFVDFFIKGLGNIKKLANYLCSFNCRWQLLVFGVIIIYFCVVINDPKLGTIMIHCQEIDGLFISK